MRRLTTALLASAVVCAGGLAFAQETASDHLKPYGPMIGTWRHEGPLGEDLEGLAEKGTKYTFEFSWRRILDKNAVMEDWSLEFEGGKAVSGKSLIGWDASQQKIVYGGMSSIGGMSLGTVEFDKQAKTSTLTARGITSEGSETTFKGVVTKTGKDTLTWQAVERTGGIAQGESPVVEFKRVPRAKTRTPAGRTPVARPKSSGQTPPIKK